MNSRLDNLAIATIRSLCIDMINKAKSGHPGMALGSAPILHTLFTRHIIANPNDDKWINRDRFVLSGGHASSLLYSILHLCGYRISLNDLKSFRQLHSITPGHPEVGVTPGVDASTGPLGQGIAEAIGLAMAETMIKATYTEGKRLVDHYTYCLCGDGCLEEGISQEAINFAGIQQLNKLILIYDANKVTLDGPLSLSSIEDTKSRFISANWNYIEVKDGNDVEAIDKAIIEAKKSKNKPTLIKINTIIGYGAPTAGTCKCHGAPLGIEDGTKTKQNYGFNHDDFFIPEEIKQYYHDTFYLRGVKKYNEYQKDLLKYAKTHKNEYERFINLKDGKLDNYISDVLPEYDMSKPKPTRNASGEALNSFMLKIPNLFGGSADVASSVQTVLKGGQDYSAEHRDGHNINYGIRELAATAIANGLLLHGGIRTYLGSFFVFVDYMKPAIRMAALMKLPMIYLLSHDSIAVGEDGPTHQPIEQLAMLRAIPGLDVLRPCDAKETYASWLHALKSHDRPTAILLSRQALPILEESQPKMVEKGAYIISDETKPDFIIIATGSEVSLALEVKRLLAKDIKLKIVSMPSQELFLRQDEEYRKKVLSLEKSKIISLEMLSTFGWGRFADINIGVDNFGLSAKAGDVINYYGFNAENIAKIIKEHK